MTNSNIYDYLKDKGLLPEVEKNLVEESVITGMKKRFTDYIYILHNTISYKDDVVSEGTTKILLFDRKQEGTTFTKKNATLLDHLNNERLFELIAKDLDISEEAVKKNALERIERSINESQRVIQSRQTYIDTLNDEKNDLLNK